MTESKIKIAPSILSADFSRLGEQVAEAAKAGADYIHVDVMDGAFVPNITIGPAVISAVRHCTDLPLDVHLMINHPERHLPAFAAAGSDIITVHVETCPHINRTLHQIKELGAKAGIAINPGTPCEMLSEILVDVDLVLVMTVNPGFGGQAFIKGVVDKIKRVRAAIDAKNPVAELEVDGGISAVTAPEVVAAGASVLVAGAAVFNSVQSVADAIRRIKQSVAKL